MGSKSLRPNVTNIVKDHCSKECQQTIEYLINKIHKLEDRYDELYQGYKGIQAKQL